MSFRVVDTGILPARRNIAVTAALAELHRAGRSPNTLRFHRYPRSVLIGRNQVLKETLRLGYCQRQGIEIARRVTGGGAVYMTPGVLAWDIVAERRRFGLTLGEAGERICAAVAGGLSRLGLPATFRPQNEVVVAGRKLCGASGTFDGATVVYQGTVLIDMDFAKMAQALRAPWAGDRADSEATLDAKLTTLTRHLGRVPDTGEVMGVITAGLAFACKLDFAPGALTEAELSLADQLYDSEIGTDAFVAGHDAAIKAPARPAEAERPVAP